MIMKYLKMLEELTFTGHLAYSGELTEIMGLDHYIGTFYEIEERNTNEQDIVIKTLKEAFGEQALKGFINLTLNMYCNDQESRCGKVVSYSFNAKPVTLHNTFFIQPPKDEERRIQGIGSITAPEEVIDFEAGTVTTNLNGTQTYDHLFNAESGWLIEGNSKQKIYLVSKFNGNTDFPDGLEIPSMTETEYYFMGRKIEVEN